MSSLAGSPLTASAAATVLGLSEDRIRAMARAGELAARHHAGVWLVDLDGVLVRSIYRDLGVGDLRGRPWSQRSAWAAMRALDGDPTLVDTLSRKARYRLRKRLEGAWPAQLLPAVRGRGAMVRFSIHPSRHEQLADAIVPSGIGGAGHHGHGLTGGTGIDGYVSRAGVDDLVNELGGREVDSGAHVLRVVDDPELIAGLTVAPRLAVAADLLDHSVEDGQVDGRVVSTIRDLLESIR